MFASGQLPPSFEDTVVTVQNSFLAAAVVVPPWLAPVAGFAQEIRPAERPQQERLTLEWIYSDEGKDAVSLPSFQWLDDGTAMLYDPQRAKKDRTLERFVPDSGERTDLIAPQAVLAELELLRETEKNEDEKEEEEEEEEHLEWPDAIDPTGRRAVYAFDEDLFVLAIQESHWLRITRTENAETSARFSPDRSHLAYVRENDLYVYDFETKKEKRLTTGGSKTLLNGTLSWVYWEELFWRQDIGYWWSPDSKAIAYLQTDESSVSVMHYLNQEEKVPEVIRQRYPKTGEANPRVRAGVVELETARTNWVDLGVYPYEYLARVKWLPTAATLAVQTLSRDQKKLDVFLASREDGAVKHLLRETDECWVNVHDDLHFFEKNERFLWLSERDGYAHLYLYGLDGTLIRQVTRGEWALRPSGDAVVVAVDEADEWIYFTALKESSIERHLYRIHPDSSGFERLSGRHGTHRPTFRADAKLYLDVFSSLSTLPTLSLRRATGEALLTVSAADQNPLKRFGILQPESLTIPAADNFPMPASLLHPRNFDPEKRHPVILNVYGGPSAPTVANAFSRSRYFDQMLADRGYIVARVDNRSATAISKTLENTIYLQGWGPGELADLLAAVTWLKSQPWVDPDRVGIWGWSGGGTFTLLAMTASQAFRAGISVAGLTSWEYYDTIYAEAFMKRPRDNPEGYKKTALLDKAKELHGRLLIVHGTRDDNVHIQSTWNFVDKLVDAGKMFDLMVYPGRKHGIRDDEARKHLFGTMLEFWERNL